MRFFRRYANIYQCGCFFKNRICYGISIQLPVGGYVHVALHWGRRRRAFIGLWGLPGNREAGETCFFWSEVIAAIDLTEITKKIYNDVVDWPYSEAFILMNTATPPCHSISIPLKHANR